MRAVVTGAAGFIGSHLVDALVARDATVVAIDRRPVATPPGGHALRADLAARADEGALKAALERADAVFHLAGFPGVRAASPDAARRRVADNVVATARVLAATPLDVPLVVTSSSSVYGGARAGRASRETDAPRPLGGYARSKAVAEALCRRRAERGGVVAVARPFTVAGEGQRPDMALARWIEAVRLGRPVRILGSAERTRDVTDVRDVVEGLVRIVERRVQATVNLGTGTPCTLGEMVACVAVALGRPADVVVEPAPEGEPAATRACTERCRALLGFAPRADLAAVVERQAAAALGRALEPA